MLSETIRDTWYHLVDWQESYMAYMQQGYYSLLKKTALLS